VEIRIPGPETLAVPLESLSEDSGETRVFVELQGRYEPRALKLGLRGERFAEVAAGLKEGDTVASSGLFWLEAQWRMDHSGKI
jgi:Cu(I)/Ag(I) efflux system membrane fusion protein